jgi:SAM-dependent methyltransferase
MRDRPDTRERWNVRVVSDVSAPAQHGAHGVDAHALSPARDLEVAGALVDHVIACVGRGAPPFDEVSALAALAAIGLSDGEIVAIRRKSRLVQLTNNIRDFALAPVNRLASPTREFVTRAQLSVPRGALLDIGCSAGRYLLEFASAEMRLVGLDIDAFSMTVAEVAWSRTQSAARPQCVVGSATSLPLPSESFDVVTSFVVLGCVPLRRTLSEIARVLVPGGRFCATIERPGFLVEMWQRRERGQRAAVRLARWWLAHLLSVVGIDHQRLPGGSRLAGVSIYARAHLQRAIRDAWLEPVQYEVLARHGARERLVGIVAQKPRALRSVPHPGGEAR